MNRQLWFKDDGEIELSPEEKDDYSFYVDKSELLNFVFEVPGYPWLYKSPDERKCSKTGTPSMLITAVSQYSGKAKKELIASDFLQMYNSIIYSVNPKEELNPYRISDWRKSNGKVKFFGERQFDVLEHYLKSIKRECFGIRLKP